MQGKLARGASRLGLAGAIAAALAAHAQVPHPIPPPVRALHERAGEAELIAIGRVARIDAGRIAFERESALRGEPPARFEVKRSPLRPPRLETGDRALLFLRGARPPYVLAGDPGETTRIEREADARALAAELPRLLSAGREQDELRNVYEGWAKDGSRLLRAFGHAGLLALPPEPAARAEPPPTG
jgi:hypothetical protein